MAFQSFVLNIVRTNFDIYVFITIWQYAFHFLYLLLAVHVSQVLLSLSLSGNMHSIFSLSVKGPCLSSIGTTITEWQYSLYFLCSSCRPIAIWHQVSIRKSVRNSSWLWSVKTVDGNNVCPSHYDWLILLMATVYVQVNMIGWYYWWQQYMFRSLWLHGWYYWWQQYMFRSLWLVDLIDGNCICSGHYDWLILLMATVYVQVIMIGLDYWWQRFMFKSLWWV